MSDFDRRRDRPIVDIVEVPMLDVVQVEGSSVSQTAASRLVKSRSSTGVIVYIDVSPVER